MELKERACDTECGLSDETHSAERRHTVNDASVNAGILANVLNVATGLMAEMNFARDDGSRIDEMDQLFALVHTSEKLAFELADEIEALPRSRGGAA